VTDVGLVLAKLARLEQQIALARARRPATPEVLSSDLILRDALALSVMVALQEAIDITYHVVADEGWGVPDSHRAAFDLLAAHGIVSTELAARLSGAAAMRNRIAHGYASVEHARLWQELPDGLAAMEEFRTAIARFLPVP
jgi:uncharacterized protein YutE (UPF0331/DUF86 family)